MADTDLNDNDMFVDTDVFVVIENEDDIYDFVTIDEDIPFESVIIDMSSDELMGAITVDFEMNTDTNDFVTLDEQIFVSDYTDENISSDWIDLDLPDDIISL